MTVVRHPTLPGVSRVVNNSDQWVAQGWVVDPPPEPPAPKPKRPTRKSREQD